jgi:tetratricopeptide (TPR) repeat protein
MANHPDSQVVQKIFENVRAEGNITVGNITQIYQIVSNLSNISKPTGFPQNIPPSSTNKFVGRARELERLHQQLQRQNEVVIAAVEGMGGVGKTELAIQYSLLHLQSHNYPGGICWLRAIEQDIGLQIVKFAVTYLGLQPPEDLELPERVSWCWNHWHQGNTLLVLDDVKNYSHIKPYLPPQPSQFKVLITTRLKLDLASSLFLEVLSETDALLLLAQLIGEEKQNQELAQALELCHRLGYLPLALQLVGRYVKKRNITLAELLRRLEEKGLDHPSLVVKENDPTWTLNVKNGVAAAFELSWSELSDDAQQLGCLLSLFALAPIPWSLVERAAVEQDLEELEDARVELENLHLLQGEQTYQLHQLIREFLREKQNNLAVSDEQKYNYCTAIVAVAKEIPRYPILPHITKFTPVIPHLAEVTNVYNNWLSDEDLITPFVRLGWFYEGQGAYQQATPWLEQCLSVARERLGEDHPSVVISFNYLAFLYKLQARYAEAEKFYQRALKIRKHLLGDNHPEIADSLHNLGSLYESQQNYAEAEKFYQQAFEMRKRLLGDNHPEIADSFDKLAAVCKLQGRYAEAEKFYQQALELDKRLFGEHPRVGARLSNLALLYSDQRRYSEAEKLYLQVLELDKRILGDDNLGAAPINLAGLYHSQGRYAEAEKFYQRALEMRKRLLGDNHPEIADSLYNLGSLYESQQNYAEAEKFYQQAFEMRKRLLGDNHPEIADSFDKLAAVCKLQGRYAEAEKFYQQALELDKRLFGEHPRVGARLNNLALVYSDQGRYSEAEPLLQKALEIASKSLGENHPNTITLRKNLKFLRDKYA